MAGAAAVAVGALGDKRSSRTAAPWSARGVPTESYRKLVRGEHDLQAGDAGIQVELAGEEAPGDLGKPGIHGGC